MSIDPGLLGAALREVINDMGRDRKVLFVAPGSPSDENNAVARDIARRAELDQWSGWAVVADRGEPELGTALDDLAATGVCAGVVLVPLADARLDLSGRDDDLDVDILELA